MTRRYLCLFALPALATACAGLGQGAGAPAASTASDPVARAAAALGGRPAKQRGLAFQAEHVGTTYASEQARSPAEPIVAAGRVHRWSFDAASSRAVRESEQTFPGNIKFWTRTALAPNGGWQIDIRKWRNGTDLDTAGAAEAIATIAQYERHFPHLLVRQAEQARSSLSAVPSGFRYRDPAGKLIEVALDPTRGLPLSASEIVDDKPQVTLAYLDYATRAGLALPGRIQLKAGGQIREDLQLASIRFTPPPSGLFEPPPGYAPPPAPGAPAAREIAPGLFFFENMPGFNYHSMAVDQGESLLLIEAPSSPAYAEEQRRLLAALRPGKPVARVLVTHPHGDHTGGVAKWAEWGAEIVVPKGARVAIERQFRARGAQPPARIVEIDGRRSFGSGPGRVDAYVFPTSHAESHLVAHAPAARLLFQGDLFYLPERGPPPPAFDVVQELKAAIERLGLDVERIGGVHGRIGSMADLNESLRRRAETSGRQGPKVATGTR